MVDSIPFFFFDISDSDKKTVNGLIVLPLMVNIQPQMVDVDEQRKNLAENDSSTREFVESLKGFAQQSVLHKAFE